MTQIWMHPQPPVNPQPHPSIGDSSSQLESWDIQYSLQAAQQIRECLLVPVV